MKYIIYMFLSVVMILPFDAMAEANTSQHDGVSLSLERKGEDFIVTVKNVENKSVKINKIFSIDPLIGSIHFVVKVNGKIKDLVAQINPIPLSEESYIELRPWDFYGHFFDAKELEMMFYVNKSCYTIYAIYQDRAANEFHSFEGKVTSNQLSVCDK